MKMSELVNELSKRIKIYGDAKIVLRDKNNYNNTKEIFDVFFNLDFLDKTNAEFVILFE